MLKIALPNKGSLSDDAVRLVQEAGYNCRRYSRELIVSDTINAVEFIFLRPRDIAIYVSRGVLDIGITGQDLSADSQSSVTELLSLGFGKSTFHYAVPKETARMPADFSGLRIATSYPNIVKQDLEKRGIDATVIKLDGAVEISIRLGVADAIADVVQTGRTLIEAGLKIVGEPIMHSQAVIIARDPAIAESGRVIHFLERLQGIVVARSYVMVEYDIESAHLDKATAITPGIESPTVAPLSKTGWVAVKSMAKKSDINQILDDLAALGARGIIITDIRTCRI
ncbi:MAG: ATP phosphoribosyltransferase [Deltaproteobacteria bacterium]|nr:MAG: ATP phosphoribosyltransferase [Deltaproteobacteria bacterium]